MQIHLQRIIGAFASSTFGPAHFYGTKKSAAMELTSKLLNDDRDEDRDGLAGFESKAERARLFATEMALQSFALLAAEPPRRCDRRLCRHHRRGLEALRGTHGTRRHGVAAVRSLRDGRLSDGMTGHGGGAGRGSAPVGIGRTRRTVSWSLRLVPTRVGIEWQSRPALRREIAASATVPNGPDAPCDARAIGQHHISKLPLLIVSL